MGTFTQFSGNALNNFLPALYAQVGVTSVLSQLVMTLVATIVSLVTALAGTVQLDRLGRRKVLIIGTLLCVLTLSCAMGASAASGVDVNAESAPSNRNASRAAIAFLILFGAVYAWGYIPLQPVYPAEVLSTEMRSAGMGCMVLVGNASGGSSIFHSWETASQAADGNDDGAFINSTVIPIALQKIGWWTYLPFICWDVVEAGVWYVFAKLEYVEELDEIFNSPNPVKASLRKRGKQVESKKELPLGSTIHPSVSRVEEKTGC
ncbi:hypothetical protein P7C73_g5771, partial [Tremellales sp. Uapishka_1]